MATWRTATSRTECARIPGSPGMPSITMATMTTPTSADDSRRAAIRRTAWAMGVCAVLVYAAFLYSAMSGS